MLEYQMIVDTASSQTFHYFTIIVLARSIGKML